MSDIESKIKAEVLYRELIKDPWLLHCLIIERDLGDRYATLEDALVFRHATNGDPLKKISDAGWNYHSRPDRIHGFLPMEYRTPVARFVVESAWADMSDEDWGRWLEVTRIWNAAVYKEIAVKDAIIARLQTPSIKGFAEKLGVTYNVAYKTVIPRLKETEDFEELRPLFEIYEKRTKSIAEWRGHKDLVEPERYEELTTLKPVTVNDLLHFHRKTTTAGEWAEREKTILSEFMAWLSKQKGAPSFEHEALFKAVEDHFQKIYDA